MAATKVPTVEEVWRSYDSATTYNQDEAAIRADRRAVAEAVKMNCYLVAVGRADVDGAGSAAALIADAIEALDLTPYVEGVNDE